VRFTRNLLVWAVIFSACVPALKAQDQKEEPLHLGAFDVQGSAGFGYRFTDVKGYQPMFLELFDLKKGPRLMELNLFGRADENHPFAEKFSLNLSGLGGDPYPTAQLTVSKPNVYDLRANWRQAYFYWDQNDGVIIPTLGTTGLTDNHDWATVRKSGSVDLMLHATNSLRFSFHYYRTTFSGSTFTTFSPDFLGSSEVWGFYARANAYRLFAPTYDITNRITGGLDYTWKEWNLHYNVGYQTFTGNRSFDNVTSPERAIDTTTPVTADELLTSVSWTDYRRLTTPVSEFSYTGTPKTWLQVRGSYLFYRYGGPAAFDQVFDGSAQTDIAGTQFAPYSVSQTGRASVTEPNHIVGQGFTAVIKTWWNVNLDYRYSRFTTDTEGTYTSLMDGTSPASSAIDNNWRDGLHQLDFDMLLTPLPNLTVRPGMSYFKSDVEFLENGGADDALTLRTKAYYPSLAVFYRPFKRLSLRANLHGYSNSASYTSITPHTDFTTRIVASFLITDRLSLQNELYIVEQKLLATNFHGKTRSNATTLNYVIGKNYSIFAGFSYGDQFASGDIQYIRGEEPLSGSIRDQDINRIWQGGFEARPLSSFGVRFTGNYVRTTGVGEANGQPPVYGPLTFPYATGTLYYDLPKAGRFSVDLQRTYYIQEIITGNNFSANMLTLRWTKSF
jgi:hypothetical protein